MVTNEVLIFKKVRIGIALNSSLKNLLGWKFFFLLLYPVAVGSINSSTQSENK